MSLEDVRMISKGYSILPKKITDNIVNLPETGMGYNNVSFLMKDGSVVNCQVINSRYVKGINVGLIDNVI